MRDRSFWARQGQGLVWPCCTGFRVGGGVSEVWETYFWGCAKASFGVVILVFSIRCPSSVMGDRPFWARQDVVWPCYTCFSVVYLF